MGVRVLNILYLGWWSVNSCILWLHAATTQQQTANQKYFICKSQKTPDLSEGASSRISNISYIRPQY